jgi:hypothetical protein
MTLSHEPQGTSLSAILSRIAAHSPPLPDELLTTILTPLVAPRKDLRDHHLLITSSKPSATAQLVRSVYSHIPEVTSACKQRPWSQGCRYIGIRQDVALRPCSSIIP